MIISIWTRLMGNRVVHIIMSCNWLGVNKRICERSEKKRARDVRRAHKFYVKDSRIFVWWVLCAQIHSSISLELHPFLQPILALPMRIRSAYLYVWMYLFAWNSYTVCPTTAQIHKHHISISRFKAGSYSAVYGSIQCSKSCVCVCMCELYV